MKNKDNADFINFFKEQVVNYFNEESDITNNKTITVDDVFLVWYNFTLGNQKALLSTTVADGMYYELTFNKDKNELYFDAYKKWKNKCIEL